MRPYPGQAGWRERLAVVALALIALAALCARSDLLEPGNPGFERPRDHHKYIHMAEGGAFHYNVAPFCWRLGLPLAVRALPLSTRDGFLALTLLSLFIAGLAVHFSARRLGFSATLSASGMLLFYSLGWASKYNLMNFWLSDAAAFAFVGGIILLTLGRRMFWAALLLLLGVTVKESVLFAAPLFYSLRTRRLWDGPLLTQSILLALPAAALLLALRAAIPMQNGETATMAALPETLRAVHHGISDFDLGYLWSEFGRRRLLSPGLTDLKEMSIWAWGPLVLFAPFFAFGRARDLFLRFAPLLLLAYAQLLLASNSQRLLMLAAPAIILPGLSVLEGWSRGLRAGQACWMLLASGLFALNLLDPAIPVAAFPVQLGYFIALILIFLIGRPFRIFDPERGNC